ncbi:MAG: hypothetical protein LBL21_02670 [Rickettsiales bacterium]|jgi:microcystin-dependent protein|nr:hypothetical protein [Rickettsiales bacterium]
MRKKISGRLCLRNAGTVFIRLLILRAAMAILFLTPAGLGAAKVCTQIVGTVEAIYPVGAIYISTIGTDPATLFGFGTWERFGNGKALVGVDESDTEFDAVEKTGGAKVHTLTIDEMPSHTHMQDPHSHNIVSRGTSSSSDGGISRYSGSSGYDTNNTSGSTTAVNNDTGGDGAHNNLQPYITVYIWRRTQ